jgi:hypothetical protein
LETAILMSVMFEFDVVFFEQNSRLRARGVRVRAWKNELVGRVPIRGTEEKKDGRAKINGESKPAARYYTSYSYNDEVFNGTQS